MSSSFWSGEFYFGGVHSDTYKVCIIDFDTSEILKQVGSTFTIELSEENTFNGIEVVHDLKLFKDISDVIIANRVDSNLEDCKEFIYSRDIFSRD